MALDPDKLAINQQAIFSRGLFVNHYGMIEFAITHIVAAALEHDTYTHLGELPYPTKTKIARFGQILAMDGPLSPFKDELLEIHRELTTYDDTRHFMVHGFMNAYRERGTPIADFMLFQHREKDPMAGRLKLSLTKFSGVVTDLGEISGRMGGIAARALRELRVTVDFPNPPWQ